MAHHGLFYNSTMMHSLSLSTWASQVELEQASQPTLLNGVVQVLLPVCVIKVYH